MGRPLIPLWERFNRQWIPEPYSGCWLWTGFTGNQGYGVMVIRSSGKKKKYTTHRIAWTLYRGPIPEGVHVLHRCDTRCCVNPDHLFLGTNDDNIKDMRSKFRHARGETTGHAKLTSSQVREIRASPLHYKTLANQFRVSPITVWDAQNNKTWRYIL